LKISALLAFASAVLLLVAGVYAYHWWRGEERVIRTRLDGLARALSPPANGGELAMVGRLAHVRSYFSPDVRLRFGSEEIVSRDALLAVVSRNPPRNGFSLQLVDVTVTLGDNGTSARVYLTAKVTGRDASTGEPTIDAHEANIAMTKVDGDWVIASVEGADTLQRP
jgi:hypothetical protein